MKPVRKSGFGRVFSKRLRGNRGRGTAVKGRDRANERKEALVLFAIAILFVANVVIYLCHHYGLASLNDHRFRGEVAPQVMVD